MENFNELGRESTALSRWIQGNNNNNMKISETMNVRRSTQLMLCVTRVQPKRKSTYKFQMIKYVEFISLSLFFFKEIFLFFFFFIKVWPPRTEKDVGETLLHRRRVWPC